MKRAGIGAVVFLLLWLTWGCTRAAEQEPFAWPATDETGFLPAGETPFVYASREEGAWAYVSQSLRVEIRRYEGKSAWGKNVWLEASVHMRSPDQLAAPYSNGTRPGSPFTTPETILRESGLPQPVLVINDDFFGYRRRYLRQEKHVGVIIRDGKTLYDDPKNSAKKRKFPPLDTLAVFADGSMQTFTSDAFTAQEYLDMGARHVFAFGPVLVQKGQVSPQAAIYGVTKAPRMALGVTADGTVKILNVLGRDQAGTGAQGVSVAWVANKMLDMGCVEALNLDGGNTTCMIFLGDMIDRQEKVRNKDIRRVSGLICFMDGAE